MVKVINSGLVMPPMPYAKQVLTPEQQSLTSDTLSIFDADNLSETDALSIVDTLSQADIKPRAALENKMSNLGFDAKQIGELANTFEPKKSPPRQSTEGISYLVDHLTQLLEEKLVANNYNSLSEESKQVILSKVLEKYGLEESRSSSNTTT